MAGASTEETKMNRKGLILLSGGLDSTLAARVMQEQGIELEAVNFLTCFCTCTKKGCKNEARKVSENLKIKLKLINVTDEYLKIIKDPEHGYGSNMNPCIDCRIAMFKKAKEYMGEIGASFIITGEVLGERPKSQRRDAMLLIEKRSGLKGLVVRPLSAKLLEPSIPEEVGIVDREMFMDISGRSRKPQMSMAKEFGINDYPCPAGGCLLTDPGFAKRMKDLLQHDEFTLENIRLLKIGRHFRIGKGAKLVVGRNKSENERLLDMAKEGDIFFDAKEIPGPIAVLRGNGCDPALIEKACSIVSRYSDGPKHAMPVTYWKGSRRDTKEQLVRSIEDSHLDEMRI